MTENTYELRSNPGPSLLAAEPPPHVRVPLPSYEQADLAARVLPPELAFLAAEGFSPEPLLSAVGAAPKDIGPLDQLLSEGRISEEFYYRTLATHLGCQYYYGEPPLARAFDAVKGLRCGVAPLERRSPGPRMVIAPRAQFVPRLIEATLSGAIRSGSFAVTSPQRFASLVRAYHSSELLDVALGRLPASLTAREGMTGLQLAALVIIAILALVLGIADLDALAAVSSAILWLIFSASVTLRSMAAVASGPETRPLELSDDELPHYTVVVALYREASVVEALVKAIDAFDYPKGKLDIKLVVERRDAETLGRIVELCLPARYEVVVAPAGKPQTKPRALNIALSSARGDFLVVFDAEDAPAPDQLLLAASRFAAEKDLDCLQARLAIRNHDESAWRQLQSLSCWIAGRGGGLGRVERYRGCGPWNSSVTLWLQGESSGFGHLGGSSVRIRKLVQPAGAMAKRLDTPCQRLFCTLNINRLAHFQPGGSRLSQRRGNKTGRQWARGACSQRTSPRLSSDVAAKDRRVGWTHRET